MISFVSNNATRLVSMSSTLWLLPLAALIGWGLLVALQMTHSVPVLPSVMGLGLVGAMMLWLSVTVFLAGLLWAAAQSLLQTRRFTLPMHQLAMMVQGELSEVDRDDLCGRDNTCGSVARALQAGTQAKDTLSQHQRETDKNGTEHIEIATVRGLIDGLHALSEGDLSQHITTTLPGPLDLLRTDFNLTVDRLAKTIKSITDCSDDVRNHAEEIDRGALDLSMRTERQAATLEQAAAALDQMTVSVGNTAKTAQSTDDVVQSTRGLVSDCAAIVGDAITAMSAVEKRTDSITLIVDFIDDVAFQTNLLALNAGVEAARAGAQGRGFSVVAHEVQALALRISGSANEIKDLIGATTAEVEAGVTMVNRTGAALDDIVAQVGELSDRVGSIATGSAEQSAGLAQINSGVAQLDQVTQQNAAMVQMTLASATTLKSDAADLRQMVSHFRLESVETNLPELFAAQ